MKSIDSLMKEALSDQVFPGGVLLVAKENSILFFRAYGHANLFSKRSMTRETVFDLASLTKPLATALAILKLIQQSKLELDQNLGTLLPQFQKTDKARITVQQLLSHTSGFPDYRPYYKTLVDLPLQQRKIVLRNFLVHEPLEYSIGKKVLYSDLGFMILSWVVETVTGKNLDRFVSEEIYKPLDLEHLFFVGHQSSFSSVLFAATEHCPWRNHLIEGVVHDENAYAVGGVEGHAGLFGSAHDVYCLLSTLLSVFKGQIKTDLFKKDLLCLFFRRQNHSDRALGFDTPSISDSSCGKLFSKESVGHLGFTGTSFWMDLRRWVTVILLTNRIHPSRKNTKIKAFRPKLHEAVMKLIANN